MSLVGFGLELLEGEDGKCPVRLRVCVGAHLEIEWQNSKTLLGGFVLNLE